MTRVIKFRVWHPVAKKLELIDGYGSADNGVFQLDNGEKGDVLMQFTGLVDRDGVEIYENDYVEVDGWDPKVYEIKFIEGAFCMAFIDGEYAGQHAGDIHYLSYGCKVIGNKWEGIKGV